MSTGRPRHIETEPLLKMTGSGSVISVVELYSVGIGYQRCICPHSFAL
jgi:hypothetical protein